MQGASIYISFNTALKQAGFGIPIFMGEGTKIPFKWHAQDLTENLTKAWMCFGPAVLLDNEGITVSA